MSNRKTHNNTIASYILQKPYPNILNTQIDHGVITLHISFVRHTLLEQSKECGDGVK